VSTKETEVAPDGPTTTLGHLLYADPAKPRVPEAEWVALVNSMAQGDQRALRELYERTHRLVFTLIVRIVNSRETAEELTLDVFHDLWRRAPAYDCANGTVLGWIMNQARSRAIDRVRFNQRKKRIEAHQQPAEAQPSGNGADEALAASQQAQVLRSALGTLTAAERIAIETAFFAECTYTEAATRLGEPVGTIKTRIRSALTKLRGTLPLLTK
jgi:RNA polymerase sigma-70 factor, ECF subfamily